MCRPPIETGERIRERALPHVQENSGQADGSSGRHPAIHITILLPKSADQGGACCMHGKMVIEVRCGYADGDELGRIKVTHESAHKPGSWTVPLRNLKDKDDLCLVLHGERDDLAGIDCLSFA